MFDLDPTKILLLLVIALLVVDPRKLPDLSRRVGRGIRQFRTAAQNLTREMGAEELVEDLKTLNQARGNLAQTVGRELGLDELRDITSSLASTEAEGRGGATAPPPASSSAPSPAAAAPPRPVHTEEPAAAPSPAGAAATSPSPDDGHTSVAL